MTRRNRSLHVANALRVSAWAFSISLVSVAVQAERTIDGHVSALVQMDSLDTQSQALNLTVPFTNHWAIEAGYSKADGETEFSPTASLPFESVQQSVGFLYDPGSWSIQIGAMQYEDEQFLQTDQYKLRLGTQGEAFSINLEAMGREHDVQLTLPNQTYQESFKSVGLGVDLSYMWQNGVRLYVGGQQYDYERADILDADFRQLLGLALLYPEYADRLLAAYRSLIIQQQRAQGGLIAKNLFAGAEWQWRNELFAVDYYVSEAEIDGAEVRTTSLLWSHLFGSDWLLDVSAGVSASDGVENSEFASIGVHFFW